MAEFPTFRAILTGASGGIGGAMARELASRVQGLILVGRKRAALEALQQELGATRVDLVCGDLCEAATRRDVRACAERLDGVNLLVNNAGTSDFHAFAQQDGAAVRALIEANLLAPMLLTQELLPLLLAQPCAQVVNVGSIFGYIGFPGYAGYCASKFGLRGFSQALRRELSDTAVEVRYFAPRATRTPINPDVVTAMNRELGNAEDAPELVAREFMEFLHSRAWERKLGAKERFFVLLNNLLPAVPDKALRGQLPIIRKYLPR